MSGRLVRECFRQTVRAIGLSLNQPPTAGADQGAERSNPARISRPTTSGDVIWPAQGRQARLRSSKVIPGVLGDPGPDLGPLPEGQGPTLVGPRLWAPGTGRPAPRRHLIELIHHPLTHITIRTADRHRLPSWDRLIGECAHDVTSSGLAGVGAYPSATSCASWHISWPVSSSSAVRFSPSRFSRLCDVCHLDYPFDGPSPKSINWMGTFRAASSRPHRSQTIRPPTSVE
jgi:hypothetical protein